jgi:hypothetical protein
MSATILAIDLGPVQLRDAVVPPVAKLAVFGTAPWFASVSRGRLTA